MCIDKKQKIRNDAQIKSERGLFGKLFEIAFKTYIVKVSIIKIVLIFAEETVQIGPITSWVKVEVQAGIVI